MASLDEIINVAQNIVQAINGAAQTYLQAAGVSSYENVTASTLIKKGQGRICRVSVLTAGSTTGLVHDAASTALTTTNNRLAVLGNTVGIVEIQMPFDDGLVIIPGTGQEVSVSYS